MSFDRTVNYISRRESELLRRTTISDFALESFFARQEGVAEAIAALLQQQVDMWKGLGNIN